MKDQITTDRDIRLTLANLLDRLGQVQNTERWETTAQSNIELQNRMSEAINAVDAVWWLWRCTTSNSSENQ